ncbi:hypothetical protein HAX54_033751 [Datura stramonium]|uniref:Uncharacterized protein n=1 Tax=Datura stramonium TaxID=4076 RepID=A0ABS8VFG6_DATST|nr:hypothetical protein [Datura stramonium]
MGQLHFFFFPMMAQGHMIPTLDMAKLVACRGVKATIITTPLNEYVFSKAIERNKHLGIEIDIRLIKFPAVENGLPEECERLDLIPSDDKLPNFFKAVAMMQEPLEQLIEECRPTVLSLICFRIGAGVGSMQWNRSASEGVKREAIAKAIKRVMVSEETEGFRSRAKAYKEMARQAIEEGGSSYTGLTTLLEDISSYSSTGH